MTNRLTSSTFAATILAACALVARCELFAVGQEAPAESVARVAHDAHDASDAASALETDGATADPAALEAIDRYVDGDVEGAYNLFKQIYDANRDSDPPGVLLALLHSHAGRFLEMRRALEQTAEDYPNDPEAYFQLADVDAREGRFLECELLLERGEKLTDDYKNLCPNTDSRLARFKEESISIRANLAEKKGKYDAARELVRKVLDLNPENVDALWNLGYLSMKLRDFDEAERAFDAAAKKNPALWAGWLQVVSSLDREDSIDLARARLASKEKEIASASKSERAQLARLYLRFHMIDEAAEIVKAFEEENDPKDAQRWILDGWLALYANRYAAAEEFFRNATVIDPTSFEASNGLALALLDQGSREKINQARTIAARNYRAENESVEASTTYAWTLFLSGAAKDADAIFQPMLSSGELNATSAYYLAEIANSRGDLELASNLADLALSQKANFPKRLAALELKKLVEEQLEPAKDRAMKDFDDELDFGEEKDDEEEDAFGE